MCVLLALAACGPGEAPTGVTVTIDADQEFVGLEHLEIVWMDAARTLFTRRAPATGSLPRMRPLPASIRIEVEHAGPRRVLIHGLGVDGSRLAAGATRIDLVAGRWVAAAVELRPGALPDADGDGVPDILEDADGGATPSDASVPVDASAPDGRGVVADGPKPDVAADTESDTDTDTDTDTVQAGADLAGNQAVDGPEPADAGADHPPSDAAADGPGTGTGLKGEYFDNQDMTKLVFSRVDPVIDFAWDRGRPDPRLGEDTFSVRWTGRIAPKHSEEYTFHLVCDDDAVLWVNGARVLDTLQVDAGKEVSGKIRLEAGRLYDFKLEYEEELRAAFVRLFWSSASQAREIVPASQLYPAP